MVMQLAIQGTAVAGPLLGIGKDNKGVYAARSVQEALRHVFDANMNPGGLQQEWHGYDWFDVTAGASVTLQTLKPTSANSPSVSTQAANGVEARIDAALEQVRGRLAAHPGVDPSNSLLRRNGRTAAQYATALSNALEAEATATRRGVLHNLFCHW